MKSRFSFCLVGLCLFLACCSDKKREAIGSTEVVIETNMGKVTLRLYDDTPQHRDNFVKLIKEGFYDGLVWNRIVSESTIQTGDPTKREDGGASLHDTAQYKYTIPAEIRYPRHFHKIGALCMARENDDVNPKKESCATQFYIVTGKVYTREKLAELHQFMDDADTNRIVPPFTEHQKTVYTSKGGAPHLDGNYTVFGEVVDGLKVIEAIGRVKTDEKERPLKKVFVKRITIQ